MGCGAQGGLTMAAGWDVETRALACDRRLCATHRSRIFIRKFGQYKVQVVLLTPGRLLQLYGVAHFFIRKFS